MVVALLERPQAGAFYRRERSDIVAPPPFVDSSNFTAFCMPHGPTPETVEDFASTLVFPFPTEFARIYDHRRPTYIYPDASDRQAVIENGNGSVFQTGIMQQAYAGRKQTETAKVNELGDAEAGATAYYNPGTKDFDVTAPFDNGDYRKLNTDMRRLLLLGLIPIISAHSHPPTPDGEWVSGDDAAVFITAGYEDGSRLAKALLILHRPQPGEMTTRQTLLTVTANTPSPISDVEVAAFVQKKKALFERRYGSDKEKLRAEMFAAYYVAKRDWEERLHDAQAAKAKLLALREQGDASYSDEAYGIAEGNLTSIALESMLLDQHPVYRVAKAAYQEYVHGANAQHEGELLSFMKVKKYRARNFGELSDKAA